MAKDIFFKFAFLSVLLVMLAVFSSNIERRIEKSASGDKAKTIIFEKVDIEKIKSLMEEGKLSDKEAIFYEKF